jgi:hypothetical protein
MSDDDGSVFYEVYTFPVRSFEFPGPDKLYERFIEEVLSHERRQTD